MPVSRGRTRWPLLAVAFALIVLLCAAASAHAYIYWAGGAIGRANLDGTNINGSFINREGSATDGVAVDGAHIYWTDDANNVIARANLDGSNVTPSLITGARGPEGLAVDGGHIYWVNAAYPGFSIGRANLDGSNVDQNFITGLQYPRGVAVDGAYIYWTSSDALTNSIGRANLNGSNVDQNFITGLRVPEAIAVNDTHIYWSNLLSLTTLQTDPKTIGRANLDGTNVNQSFITGIPDSPSGIAVDAAHIYWTETGPGSLARGNLDGTNVNHRFIHPISLSSVAVDAMTQPPVVIAPPVNITPPRITGKPKVGGPLKCSSGKWRGNPTAFAYQWNRNHTALVRSTGNHHTVATLDEGSTMTCTVTARNGAGSTSATSRPVNIPIPFVAHCPGATGRLSGATIGLIRLGMSRRQAQQAYAHHSNRGKQYEDFFCLTPIGVRVGYASPKLLNRLSQADRGKLKSRVVWASTSNPHYALNGIRPGASITAASARLHPTAVLHIGLNYWYLARKHNLTAVLKVRHGEVQELGIAINKLTATQRLQSILMHSFY